MGLLLLGLVLCAVAATKSRPAVVSPWDAALLARAQFEAQPASRHSKADFARVIDRFRAIYHDGPATAHAARAVEQVAELLAMQGRELEDRKSLRDAARQYEFLAKAYPGPAQSPHALGQALALLGPDAADDAVESKQVRRQLLDQYPNSPAARAARMVTASAKLPASTLATATLPTATRPAATRPQPQATVTGIRHWSTGSYTRVAIDLGPDAPDDLAYQAVRVSKPDRIFFDLQHAKLAAQLQGKTFTVTDGGLLDSIRGAQLPDGSTRVVLDVHAVGTYSAFLLPNPERLIIDIHGSGGEAGTRDKGQGASDGDTVAIRATPAPQIQTPRTPAATAVRTSSLPPMPVTDGSASFGLPAHPAPKTDLSQPVPQPRVVISTRPTVARPVPNTVTKTSANPAGDDIAAVSEQGGRIAATAKPTSLPVASRNPDTGSGDHYRSPRTTTKSQAVTQAPESEQPAANEDEPSRGQTSGSQTLGSQTSGSQSTTLLRALGLKIGRIVIDAGHGGHDSGTLGAGGIEEKDVVLDVALRLGKLLHDRLGAEIVYTRADDTFIPLETRTAIANKAQADLFISVHANSSPDASARGVEVYYLNFTSDPDAMNVASRENAVSTQSVHDLSGLVKKIALKDKIDESRELASDVDASLYSGLRRGNDGLKDRGVKKAPFVVLIGANMPSILAEISFVTNPDDAGQLQTPEYRERVAESLYKGVAKYAAGINHAAPARGKPPVMERAAMR